jgi:uncharacterized membrane protein YeaQ/YmgE (transglycosylase-associated protein family)
MHLIDLIVLLVIAGVVGGIGQSIAGLARGGCLTSIAVGFAGAMIGMWLAKALGLPEIFLVHIGGARFPIIWSIIGSALFVAVIGFLSRRHL